MNIEDIPKKTLQTHEGYYEILVMHFDATYAALYPQHAYKNAYLIFVLGNLQSHT